jgi:hypothetical protein
MAVILDSPIVRERWFRLYRLREHWPPSDKAELRRMCEEAVRTHPIRRLPTVHNSAASTRIPSGTSPMCYREAKIDDAPMCSCLYSYNYLSTTYLPIQSLGAPLNSYY